MKPTELALRRFRSNLSYQWKAAGTVLDWTVWLYFVVPLLLLGVKFYVDWWLKPIAVPEVLQELQLWIALFILPFFWTRLRTWQEAGDVLFIRQLPDWWQSLVRFGIAESMLRQAFVMLLLVGAAAPWLIKAFHLSPMQVLSLSLLTWLASCLSALIHNQVQVCLQGWLRVVMGMLLFVAVISMVRFIIVPMSMHLLTTLMTLVLLVGLLQHRVRWRIRTAYTFERDIDIEIECKLKLTNRLLAQAVGKPPKKRKGKRPLLFRRSGYLFMPKTDVQQIGALAVKTLWRSGSHVGFYAQLVGICTAASMMTALNVPSLLVLVIPLLSLLLGFWLNGYWRELLSSETWSLYTFEPKQLFSAAKHYVLVQTVIPALCWSLAAAVWMPTIRERLIVFIGVFVVTMFGSSAIMGIRGWKVKDTLTVDNRSDIGHTS